MRKILLCFVVAAIALMGVQDDAHASFAAEVCEASWYGPGFYGNLTASGEIYTGEAGTAASPYLPFGTVVGVRNLLDGSYTELVITDRGPYAYGRCLDVSAGSSWIVDYAVAPVRVTVLY